jgi:hypothetical protein
MKNNRILHVFGLLIIAALISPLSGSGMRNVFASNGHLDWFDNMCFVTRTVEIGPISDSTTTTPCFEHSGCFILRTVRVYQVHCQQCAIHLRNRTFDVSAHRLVRNINISENHGFEMLEGDVSIFQPRPRNYMSDLERSKVSVIDFSEDFNPNIRIAPIIWDMVQIDVYDEKLDTMFFVSVTRPYNFIESHRHPALIVVLNGTEDHDIIGIGRDMMSKNIVEQFLIVTIAFDPVMDEYRELFNDFINKKLLPFINEELFYIDFDRSVLYTDLQIPELEYKIISDFELLPN